MDPMTSPFPGMDPYLEAPGLWPDFHDSFLAYAREFLQAVLPGAYYAQLRTREELGIAGYRAERVFHPDVAVRERPGESRGEHPGSGPPLPGAEGSSMRTTTPDVLVIAAEDPLEVSYLEIREVNGDRLVTLVEMLSPANKLPGQDRKRFERKREEILRSDASWVEIDLLRSGKRSDLRVDMHCRAKGHQYAVVVSRSSRREPLSLEVYGFTVRDRLPVIAVPLREADPDVALDLRQVFGRTYETGPYRKVIRYDLPPEPALPTEDAAWAAELVARR